MILIVEDNLINQQVILSVLSLRDYEAEIVSNGAEAVSIFPDLKPAVILMDISMPIMNGYDATRAIRKLEEKLSLHTAIIAITAHAAPEDMEQCFLAGMDDYITKPIEPDLLLGIIAKYLDSNQDVPPGSCSAS